MDILKIVYSLAVFIFLVIQFCFCLKQMKNVFIKKSTKKCVQYVNIVAIFVVAGILMLQRLVEEAIKTTYFSFCDLPEIIVIILLPLVSILIIIFICISQKAKQSRIWTTILLISTLFDLLCLNNYVYPLERPIKAELYYVIDIPQENSFDYPREWRVAYEQYGFYAASNREYELSFATFPELDIEHHTYIISYGQTIQSLTYNVWDDIHNPVFTGAYEGHITFDEAFYPTKIFIYELSKIRIENVQ